MSFTGQCILDSYWKVAQWGKSSSVSYAKVSFPIAFTSNAYCAVNTKNRSGSDHYPLNIIDVGLTGCTMAQSSDIAECFWIALGK